MMSTASIAFALVLFASAPSRPQRSEPLPASTLPLRLVGVMRANATPARSAALIQCTPRQERPSAWLFAVGERACDVAEITEVREDAVVIRNLATGHLELLTLANAGAPTRPPSSSTDETPIEEPDTIPEPLVRASSADVVNVELRRELLHRYMSNLPEVLSAALATPRYSAAGSSPPVVEGYAMSRIKAGGIVDQLGLQEGDVLLEFNGQKLNSLAAVTSLLGQAQALDGGKMTVLRNGRQVTFVFSVK